VATAKEMGLPEADVEELRRASVLHDLGKIGVRETVLNKPSKLTPEEFAEVVHHPVISVSILEPIPFFRPLLPYILHHHERYNGCGYPDGLAGEEIPLASRIMAVADTFDAMTSTRAYRKALPVEEATTELLRCSGTQFDPDIVRRFLACLPRIRVPAEGRDDG